MRTLGRSYFSLLLVFSNVGQHLLTILASMQVAAQLGAMRDENRKMWEHLAAEKKRSEKLVGVVGRLWEAMNSRFPGSGELVQCFCLAFPIH